LSNEDSEDIIESLKNLPESLIELELTYCCHLLKGSLIYKNLELASHDESMFEEFEGLQNVRFLQLQVLKFLQDSLRSELLVNFLKKNGENLKELYADRVREIISLITEFCPMN
jgi:hypothetical protein